MGSSAKCRCETECVRFFATDIAQPARGLSRRETFGEASDPAVLERSAVLPRPNREPCSEYATRSRRQRSGWVGYPVPTSRLYKVWRPIQNHTTVFSCSTASAQ